ADPKAYASPAGRKADALELRWYRRWPPPSGMEAQPDRAEPPRGLLPQLIRQQLIRQKPGGAASAFWLRFLMLCRPDLLARYGLAADCLEIAGEKTRIVRESGQPLPRALIGSTAHGHLG